MHYHNTASVPCTVTGFNAGQRICSYLRAGGYGGGGGGRGGGGGACYGAGKCMSCSFMSVFMPVVYHVVVIRDILGFQVTNAVVVCCRVRTARPHRQKLPRPPGVCIIAVTCLPFSSRFGNKKTSSCKDEASHVIAGHISKCTKAYRRQINMCLARWRIVQGGGGGGGYGGGGGGSYGASGGGSYGGGGGAY